MTPPSSALRLPAQIPPFTISDLIWDRGVRDGIRILLVAALGPSSLLCDFAPHGKRSKFSRAFVAVFVCTWKALACLCDDEQVRSPLNDTCGWRSGFCVRARICLPSDGFNPADMLLVFATVSAVFWFVCRVLCYPIHFLFSLSVVFTMSSVSPLLSSAIGNTICPVLSESSG